VVSATTHNTAHKHSVRAMWLDTYSPMGISSSCWMAASDLAGVTRRAVRMVHRYPVRW
jgi:hypothetical protein